MLIRLKRDIATTGLSGEFNLSSGVSEVVAHFGDATTSVCVAELDVYLHQLGRYMDMREAFKCHALLMNTQGRFFEPRSSEERAKGWGAV